MVQSKCFTLVIDGLSSETINFRVISLNNELKATYHLAADSFSFDTHSSLFSTLKSIEFQLKKVITSAIKGVVMPGQSINFVFIDDFPFLSNSDYLNYICVDQRQNNLQITVNQTGSESIIKIYSDGSCVQELMQSGFAGIIEYPDGSNEVYSHSLNNKSSNLTELLAVIDGIKRVNGAEKVQINTDSRFVIRGISQWIHFWKFNNWQTAFGSEVKFARHWQQLNELIQEKYIELKWIKGHSGHTNHTFCHDMAKEIASKPIKVK